MATNLYQFYTSQGQSLPSVSERAKIYETSGLGSASTYTGSASQNAALLAKLSAGATVTATPQTTTPQVTSTAQPATQTTTSTGFDKQALINAMVSKGYNVTDATNQANSANAESLAREYLGTGTVGTNIQTSPSIDLTALYDNLYNKAGINDLQAKLTQQEQAYNLAVSKINDNPYLSEATRVGRISKLTTDYQNSVKPIQEQIDLATTDVKNRLGLASQQYEYGVQEKQNAISQFNSLLSSGALNDVCASTIASLASSTGLSTDVIQSAITANKKKNVSTQLIQSEDDNGNVTVSVVDSNTGDIIKQTSLGNIGTKTKVAGSATATKEQEMLQNKQAIDSTLIANTNSYGHVSPAIWNAALRAYISDGLGSASEFNIMYGNLKDPNREDEGTSTGYILVE